MNVEILVCFYDLRLECWCLGFYIQVGDWWWWDGGFFLAILIN